MQANEPTIDLIVPTLNSHGLLPKLVTSLQQQSWPYWRVLFIDGSSGEEHRAWLNKLCTSDHRFLWQEQNPEQPGIYGAMNQGFAVTSPNAWMLFWGSDDWAAAPDALERLVGVIQNRPQDELPPDLVVCAGRYAIRDNRGQIHPGRRTAFQWRHSYRRSLFLGSTPPHQGTLIGPGARRLVGRYAPGFHLSADLDYFLQLSRFPHLRVERLELELVRMEAGGVSGRQTNRRLHEVRCAYQRAFSSRWWIPFLLRYLQRAQSAFLP